jgi:hypothetical protein
MRLKRAMRLLLRRRRLVEGLQTEIRLHPLVGE